MRDFKVYRLQDLPDGRCAVLLHERDIEDVTKEFGDVNYDDLEDIKIFPTRNEANDWRTNELLKTI